MPPALGSGLAAELERNNAQKEQKQDRGKRKQVSFGTDVIHEEKHAHRNKGGGKSGKGKSGGKGKKGHKLKQLSKVKTDEHDKYDDNDDENIVDDDDEDDDDAEEMIGKKRRKERKGNASDDEYDDDDDDEDAERNSRRRRGGDDELSGEESDGDHNFNDAGEIMEAFNLKEEREQGHFDEAGNYIWRKTEDASDEWLRSMGGEAGMEAAIGQAAAAQRKQLREMAAKEAMHAQSDEKDTLELLKELHSLLLDDEETIVKAMKRLSPPKKLTKQQLQQQKMMNQNKKNKNKVEEVEVELTMDEIKALKVKFATLTEISDKLLSGGEVNIYQMSREDIEAKIAQLEEVNAAMLQFTSHTTAPRAGVSGNGSSDNPQVSWEYKGADGAIHGPYTNEVMLAWRMQGFFTGESAVMMRKVSTTCSTAQSQGNDSLKAEEDNKDTNNNQKKNNMEDLMADFDDSDDETLTSSSSSSSSSNVQEVGNGNGGEETKKRSAGAFGGGMLDELNSPDVDDEDTMGDNERSSSYFKKMKVERPQEEEWKLSDSINFHEYC